MGERMNAPVQPDEGESVARHHLPPTPTPRLAFRQMTQDDLDDMAALLGDPDVMRHYRS